MISDHADEYDSDDIEDASWEYVPDTLEEMHERTE